MLTRDAVLAAAARIAPYVRRTPLVATRRPGLWLKLENDQVSGAFKARGAFAALTALPDQARASGVVTHSSGNHGRALAEAGRTLGVPVTVVVPDTALPHKVAAIRAAGARVVEVPVAERAAAAESFVARGLTLVPPFDHLDVMAGQGTVAVEILDQAADQGLALQQVWVPVGGGGLAGGVAVALDGSGVEAVAVEPALAGDYAAGVAAGRHVSWDVSDTGRTVADGLRLPAVGHLPWQHLWARSVRAVTVSEAEIVAAQRWLADQGIPAEPSGAVSVAGALADADGVVVAVVSGGNAPPEG